MQGTSLSSRTARGEKTKRELEGQWLLMHSICTLIFNAHGRNEGRARHDIVPTNNNILSINNIVQGWSDTAQWKKFK